MFKVYLASLGVVVAFMVSHASSEEAEVKQVPADGVRSCLGTPRTCIGKVPVLLQM